jgi:hypothetical protein
MRLLRGLAALLVVTGTALMASVPGNAVAGAATTQVGAPTDRLQVWNLNTHGMATDSADCVNESPCTDYREFVDYITDPARVAYFPDIVTLQEAGTDITSPSIHLPSCHVFETALESRTSRDYNCYETTEQGGAAIVYRTGRLSYVGGTRQSVQLEHRASTGADCTPTDWYALVLRLTDDLNSGHFINVASVHLPTSPTNSDADCAWENMKTIDSRIDGLGSASMKVMAGDWNHADATASSGTFSYWECWYAGTNVDLGTCGSTVPNLGWKDAMYRACGLTGAAAYDCLRANHWTHGSGHDRIDFLFAKTYAIYNQVTVDYAAAVASAGNPPNAATRYSDHRGQGALLRY